ncbi:MAG: tRNA (N6-threonylcarbamoyladenosine(37)-N6)-methyltransferase TrmO [Tepidisphaerales bacterium]
MRTSRRQFMSGAAQAGMAVTYAGIAGAAEAGGEDATTLFKLVPVGRVEKRGETARIRILDKYADALLGLDAWSHVNVFYWFDQNDVPEKRRILRVNPRGDKANPLTGVFACRAPVRPNLIALSVCKILSVEGNVVNLDGIDAFDATPVLDLKPFIPQDAPAAKDVRVPDWAKRGEPRPG